jgi:hypothetical protein
MTIRSALALVFWLGLALGAVLAGLVPSPALAHPGHGPARANADLAYNASVASLADPAEKREAATIAELDQGLDVAPQAASPVGPSCCGASHCFAAVPSAAPAPPAAPATARLALASGGLPSGLGATTLPEPPRPLP